MEEKNSFLYIVFIFIGVAAISLGVFYYATDSQMNEELDDQVNNVETNNNESNKTKEVTNMIKEFDIKDGESIEQMLSTGTKINLSTKLDETTKHIFYNEVEVANMDLTHVNKYYMYNDYFILFSLSLTSKVGEIYVVDTSSRVQKIEELDINNRIMRPTSLILDNNKLVATGTRLTSDNKITVQDKEIDICNDEELEINNIVTDTPTKISYIMNIVNQNVMFDFMKVEETLGTIKNLMCYSVE